MGQKADFQGSKIKEEKMRKGFTFIDAVILMVMVSFMIALIVFKVADNSLKTADSGKNSPIRCASSTQN